MAERIQENGDVQKPKSKLPLKTLLIILVVFLLEGGTISLFWVMKGGPKLAEATDPIEQTHENPNKEFSEVVLVDNFAVDNHVSGRSKWIITLEVAAKVESAKKGYLEDRKDVHKKEILNTVRIIISSAQPDDMKDPQKQVIKREIKSGIEKIVGEDLIKEILLPIWQTYISD